MQDVEKPLSGRLPQFAVLSGIGWLLDFGVFNTLAYAGIPVFAANVFGASCGVLFVFATGRRFLFRNAVTSLQQAIILYVAWNAVAILAASLLISVVAHLLDVALATSAAAHLIATLPTVIDPHRLAPPVAKIAITPLTMYANYLAMGLINDRRLTFY